MTPACPMCGAPPNEECVRSHVPTAEGYLVRDQSRLDERKRKIREFVAATEPPVKVKMV